MNWITVIWSMNAGACLTLAVFYGAVWCKQRENKQAELLAQQQHGELEAVRNAVEHGAAREALIQLTIWSPGHAADGTTRQQDGEGFDTKTNGHGMGLRIMRYRAQCIGSSCEVHTGASKGITVYCRAPLEAQPSLSTIS